MGIKSILAKPFASYIHKKTQKWALNAGPTQEKVFLYLLKEAAQTQFGKDHNFSEISSYEDFKKN